MEGVKVPLVLSQTKHHHYTQSSARQYICSPTWRFIQKVLGLDSLISAPIDTPVKTQNDATINQSSHQNVPPNRGDRAIRRLPKHTAATLYKVQKTARIAVDSSCCVSPQAERMAFSMAGVRVKC